MFQAVHARAWARTAGVLYLIVIAGGMFAEAFVRQGLLAPHDAPATAANLVANQFLFRLAFIADMIPLLCNAGLAVIFYGLFARVSQPIAALAVILSLIGTATQAAALLFHIQPLLLLDGNPGLAALGEPQRQALAYLSLRLMETGYTSALLFFGCFGLCLGYLIFRSGFMPRLLGVLMSVAGFCYFSNSMLYFLAPSLASIFLLLPCLVGELGLALWLTFVGLNPSKWEAKGNPLA